jgi:hypothetical protein
MMQHQTPGSVGLALQKCVSISGKPKMVAVGLKGTACSILAGYPVAFLLLKDLFIANFSIYRNLLIAVGSCCLECKQLVTRLEHAV